MCSVSKKGEVMGLTDELREWARNHRAELSLGQLSERKILDIANRIQATATTNSLDAFFNGYSMAIDEFSDKSIHLPVDANFVPIHVGDRLDGYGKTIEVVELRYVRSGWVMVSKDGNAYADSSAFKHHHHAPTVEDVLREFAYWLGVSVADSYVAATAAKLRLAEDKLAEDNNCLYPWERDE